MNKLSEHLKHAGILIVDDKPANVALLEDMLEEEGYENLVSTTDPRMVLPLCREERFDLILLDIRMPHMSGIDVMVQLREALQVEYLPILVLTAQTDLQTRKESLKAGAKDFLTKPFDHWEVLLRIRNTLETSHYYNRQVMRAEDLESEVRKRTRELRDAQLEIVRRLGRAGEYRDNETGMHVMRMSKVCHLMARKMGFDEAACEHILYASPMHDVGKIGIPDSILLKEGPLSRSEWEIMKRHTLIGKEILGDHASEIIQMAGNMALYHHEKWDGTGYPFGMRGPDTPVYARIVTVSDVFDALTSARPYKEPWPVEKAVAFVVENAGIHFDADLVRVFMDILPDVLKIREQYPD